MENTYKKRKNLFLQQSYRDSWEDYERSINKDNFITWDYLIITASNEEQADCIQTGKGAASLQNPLCGASRSGR